MLDPCIRQCEYIAMATKVQFDLERFFQALGDKTRLRLLNLMGDQEICVCYFVEILGYPQPKISRHLAYLRGAGIIKARREGKWNALPDCHASAHRCRADFATDTCYFERGKGDAGGPCEVEQGMLRAEENSSP
jgi:DNA-binding transcriptional ArsR family regulator